MEYAMKAGREASLPAFLRFGPMLNECSKKISLYLQKILGISLFI
jgi:hypothetical protein